MTSGSTIVPCLWFDDHAEPAAAFYRRTFPGGHIVAVSHYPTTGEIPSGKPPGSVLTVEVEIAGRRFTLLNGGPEFVMNPSVSFLVEVGTADQVTRLFDALSEGGNVRMALEAYPFSERYAWVEDRFGASWQLMANPERKERPSVAPCLMFSDAIHGKAEQALKTYAEIFPDGRVTALHRYEPGEGPEGTIKHGRASLAGEELVAMDSHVVHGFAFGEGTSLQVMCEDQREVDRYWKALSEGGEEGPCGWLKDRFGLSWQVVPRAMTDWITSKDVAARDRAFAAMLKMRKLDIAKLQAAFAGK